VDCFSGVLGVGELGVLDGGKLDDGVELDSGAEEAAPDAVAGGEPAVVTEEATGCCFGLLRSEGKVAIARTVGTTGIDALGVETPAASAGERRPCPPPLTSDPTAKPAPRPAATTTANSTNDRRRPATGPLGFPRPLSSPGCALIEASASAGLKLGDVASRG
jgi:hypothetical protein